MFLILLGKKIRNFRIITGLSQEAFSLKIGMDRTYFSAVELGKHNITILNLKKICDGLGISLSDLLEEVID
jgi:transcriptional regulator with XRE-family HTH domain